MARRLHGRAVGAVQPVIKAWRPGHAMELLLLYRAPRLHGPHVLLAMEAAGWAGGSLEALCL